MTNPFNQRIIFTDKADLLLLDIIKKYGLEEKDADIIKRLKERKSSPGTIIVKNIKNFVRDTISEKDLTLLFQKELNIAQQSAQNLFKEIKEKIIPLLEKISEEKIEKTKKSTDIDIEEKPIIAPIKKPFGKNDDVKKITEETDVYREPID